MRLAAPVLAVLTALPGTAPALEFYGLDYREASRRAQGELTTIDYVESDLSDREDAATPADKATVLSLQCHGSASSINAVIAPYLVARNAMFDEPPELISNDSDHAEDLTMILRLSSTEPARLEIVLARWIRRGTEVIGLSFTQDLLARPVADPDGVAGLREARIAALADFRFDDLRQACDGAAL